jgi:hypothetical protein
MLDHMTPNVRRRLFHLRTPPTGACEGQEALGDSCFDRGFIIVRHAFP